MTLLLHDPGDAGVRKIEDTPDSRMTGAFDNRKILFPGHPIKGLLDALDERVVVCLIDIVAGKFWLDGDRAHVLDRDLGSERLPDQDTVLIDIFALELDKALTDRLDEPDSAELLSQRSVETERSGSLTGILLGSRNEDARGGCVQRRELRRRVPLVGKRQASLDDVGFDHFGRIELAILNSLEANQGCNCHDVVDFCSARHIGRGSRKTQQNLPVDASASDVLNKLCSDIATVELGKYQNVRFSSDGARPHFALSNLGNERRVRLHLAIDRNLNTQDGRRVHER